MSWASIARTTSKHKQSPSLIVKYNTDSTGLYYVCIPKKADQHENDDSIEYIDSKPTSNVIFLPQNWDGNWIDFEKHTQLQHHIESLPFSIRCIIKFAQQRIGYNKIIKLNYDEIDKDLKYQYRLCNGDKKKLNKLYFHYNPTYKPKPNEHYDPFNLMYFGKCLDKLTNLTLYQSMKNYSLTHYLATEIVFGCLIPNDPALILLKLLIKNKIVDCDDTIHYSVWDGAEFSIYDIIVYKAVQRKERDDVIQNIEHFVDLIMCCVEQKKVEEQSAVLEVIRYVDQYKARVHQRILGVGASWNNFTYGPDTNIKYNDTQIIEKLLFRGMLPFQFCDKIKTRHVDSYGFETATFKPFNEKKTKEYLDNLFNDCIINSNVLEVTETFPKNQMAVVAPLLILPHLNKAKEWMKQILMECMHNGNDYNGFSIEIANIICDCLYVNYNIFYNKEIQNNLNVKAMLFFDHILHFEMDKQFVNDFYQMYSADKGFLHYMVNNYLYTLTSPFKELQLINFDIIIALIEIYNHGTVCLEGDKFPLESYGIYHMLSMLLHNPLLKEYYESFINLLKYIKTDYKGLFDINYNYFEKQKSGVDWDPDMMAISYHKPTTLMTMLLESESSQADAALIVMEFILNEFKNECDINDPCLVTSCFKYQNLEIFKYLVINYGYSLERVCNILKKSMICNNRNWAHPWDNNKPKQNYQFLRDVKECCVQLICQNDADIQSLNDFIEERLSYCKKKKYR